MIGSIRQFIQRHVPSAKELKALQSRVATLEAHAANPVSPDSPPAGESTLDLREKAFQTVLDADTHQDEKANRILTAVAFLTAAAAAVFAAATSVVPSESILRRALQGVIPDEDLSLVASRLQDDLNQGRMTVWGQSAAAISFFALLAFVISGVILYLGALGPTFNVPKKDLKSSHLFFLIIAQMDKQTWEGMWSKSRSDLVASLESDYVFESLLIARKARYKVQLMSIGSMLFKAAMVFWLPLLSTFLTTDSSWLWFSLFLGSGLLFLDFGLETSLRPPKEARWPPRIWFTSAAASAVVAGFFFCRGLTGG